MPVPSLLQLAQKRAMRNIRAIPDVGLAPYNLIKPILAKIDKPEHLRSLELKSPHIQEDDAELWINFIKRDVPGWDQITLPKDPDCWYDVYRDLVAQAQEELNRDAQKMKSALEELNSDRAKNTARVVDPTTFRRLPKEPPTQKQRYASHDRRMGGLTPVFAAPGDYKPGGSFGNLDGPIHTFETPRLPRSSSGKSSSSSGLFAPVKRKKALNVPTHRLTSRSTPIREAPRAFIHERKLAQAPKPAPKASSGVPSGRVIAPGRQSRPGISAATASGPSLQEREARLRNLTATNSKPTPVPSAPSASSPKAKTPIETTVLSPPRTHPKPITLFGCSPSTTPPRITKVQASPPQKSAPPASKPTAAVTKPTPAKPVETNSSSPPKRTASASPPTSDNNKPAPPPPMIRKRPPPAVFIQPKKRKVA